jgi:hypothetical protein
MILQVPVIVLIQVVQGTFCIFIADSFCFLDEVLTAYLESHVTSVSRRLNLPHKTMRLYRWFHMDVRCCDAYNARNQELKFPCSPYVRSLYRGGRMPFIEA